MKSCNSSRFWLIVERLITLESKILIKISLDIQLKRFCRKFLQTFVQQAKTCLDRTISPSRIDLMEIRNHDCVANRTS